MPRDQPTPVEEVKVSEEKEPAALTKPKVKEDEYKTGQLPKAKEPGKEKPTKKPIVESKDITPDLTQDIESDKYVKSEDSSSEKASSMSEQKSLSQEEPPKETIESPKDDILPKVKGKGKPEKKMTLDEKLAAEKAKKEVKEEEAPFAGLKLKKRERVKRQWTEPELEGVELKAHKFEELPQTEGVNRIMISS